MVSTPLTDGQRCYRQHGSWPADGAPGPGDAGPRGGRGRRTRPRLPVPLIRHDSWGFAPQTGRVKWPGLCSLQSVPTSHSSWDRSCCPEAQRQAQRPLPSPLQTTLPKARPELRPHGVLPGTRCLWQGHGRQRSRTEGQPPSWTATFRPGALGADAAVRTEQRTEKPEPVASSAS